MCDCNEIEWHVVNEDSTFVMLARIQKTDGTYAVKADVNSISVTTYDITDVDDVTTGGEQIGNVVALVVNDVMLDALVTGSPIWKKDSTGFDFKLKGKVDDAGRRYRKDVFFTMTNGDTQKPKFYLRAN